MARRPDASGPTGGDGTHAPVALPVRLSGPPRSGSADRRGAATLKRVLLLIKGLGRGGAEHLLAATTRWVDRERFAYEVAYLLPRKDALVGEIESAGVPVRCLGPSPSRWV